MRGGLAAMSHTLTIFYFSFLLPPRIRVNPRPILFLDTFTQTVIQGASPSAPGGSLSRARRANDCRFLSTLRQANERIRGGDMALVEINTYAVHWDIDGHFGNIQLNLANNTSFAIGGQTPDEMHMLVDLLRNEKPIRFDTDQRRLSTSLESVGEGE